VTGKLSFKPLHTNDVIKFARGIARVLNATGETATAEGPRVRVNSHRFAVDFALRSKKGRVLFVQTSGKSDLMHVFSKAEEPSFSTDEVDKAVEFVMNELRMLIVEEVHEL
jgi:hypothetical protein